VEVGEEIPFVYLRLFTKYFFHLRELVARLAQLVLLAVMVPRYF
jgi:hypothetical protein